jgi:AcrR family transcriptional regulator
MSAAARRSRGAQGRIVDFARDLFFRYGFTRVTIDEIAAQLHISKTTFYRFFKSKEDLLAEVMRAYYRRIQDGISDIMAHGSDGYIQELKAIMLFIGDMLKPFDVRARQDIRASAPGIWQTLQGHQHDMVQSVLEKVLRKGIRSKLVRADIDARKVADLLVVTFENALDSDSLRGLSLTMEDAIRTLIDVFLGGLLVKP